jgi:hypothetical protein
MCSFRNGVAVGLSQVRHPRLRIHRRKHGNDTFTAIRDALAGNPWMPPIPASA